jgi:hypothetical protein
VCSMQQHPSNLPLNIRCCFVLGNLTAADEQQRIDLAQLRGGVSTLMGLLSTHTKVVIGEHQSPSQRSTEGGDSSEDLLVKLVRTIAHMAISPTAGPELACHESIENLVKLLGAPAALSIHNCMTLGGKCSDYPKTCSRNPPSILFLLV